MTIKYNDIDFDVTDNGDGTFTLAPVGAASAAELVAQYRAVRDEGKAIIAYRAKLKTQFDAKLIRLNELKTQRDALKVLLDAAGAGADDDEVVVEETP